MARINGTPVFSALHSTVNEYGEVRAMVLTPTKAHDQIMPVLAQIPKSLALYGHDLTEVVYTDNVRADKHELERAFPSLLKNVTPVINHSALEPLSIPSHWSVVELSSTTQINIRLNTIMNHSLGGSKVIVAFDMEWPVDLSSGVQGLVSVIQIGYQETIYVIKVQFPQAQQIHFSDCCNH